MRLNHNLASLNIYRSYSRVLEQQSVALGKISSGYKVNSAGEDPNALAQSERMRMQIRGLQMASRNSQDGVSMLQTVDGGLDNMTNLLQRVKELVVQSGSGAMADDDRKVLQDEIDQMIDSMDGISKGTEFNGVKLLNSEDGKSLSMSVGANVGEKVEIPVYKLTSDNLKDEKTGFFLSDIKSEGNKPVKDGDVGTALDILDSAINTLISARSKYGALENRFEDGLNNINDISDRIEGADSSIRDTDMAEQAMEYARCSILVESGNAMMVQSNKLPQDILRVLENVKGR